MKLFVRNLFIFLGFSLLVTACVHAPPAKPTGLTPKAFWKEQSVRWSEVSKISAKLGLDYRGIKESVGGQARMIAQLPHQFRLELRDPFGKLRYVVTLMDKDFTAYFPTLNLAYTDDTAGKSYLKNLIGTDLTFAEVQGLALGLLPKSFFNAEFSSWDWDGGRGQYVAKIENHDRKITLFVDRDRAVLRELWVNSSVSGMTKITFSEFAPCCGGMGSGGKANSIYFAYFVALNRAQNQTSLEIEWKDLDRLEKSRPDVLFRTELPDGIEHVKLK